MAEGGELRGFVFAITFLLVFAGLIGSIPTDFQGQGGTVETLLPVNPNLFTDFSSTSTDFTRTDFSGGIMVYDYDLGGHKWRCLYDGSQFSVYRKILLFGLWFGATDSTQFYLDNGTSRDQFLSYTELEGDAEDGAVRYDLEYTDSGNAAGGFLFYWNTTLYPDPEDAWDNDVLYLLHGVGIDSTAAQNVFTLLIGLLFFQLPEVPVLVNLIIATPIWACIVFLIWYAVTKSLPLVG